jgi:hypothetical protein
MSPAAIAASRAFAKAFEHLTDLAKTSPDEAAFVAQQVSAHLRSAFPSSVMLDTGPVARIELDPEPAKASKP